jgi:hypothetical protein
MINKFLTKLPSAKSRRVYYRLKPTIKSFVDFAKPLRSLW